MTSSLSDTPAARPRWRSVIASLVLAGALVASSTALPATAVVVGSGPGSVSGTVTSDGQPVEGAFVSVSISAGQGTIFHESTNTDAAGNYEFTGLELDTYAVQAFLFGFPQPPFQSAALTAESPSATVDFVLTPYEVGVGTISGHVTADGAPLAFHGISAFSNPSGQSVFGVTDENGDYLLTDLPNGQWQVSASGGPQYQTVFPVSVQLTDESPNATADFAFVSWPVGTASISGVVTDAATGEPIANATVSASSQDAPHQSYQSTDETGAFTFELLPEGTYFLHFWSFGYLHSEQEIQVLDGESVTANRALLATTSTISGHIKTKAGAPVAGIYVSAYTADGNSGGAETDENGNYLISELGATEYTLTVGGITTPYKAKERVVTAVVNGNITANFTLKNRKTGSLLGFVAGPNGDWYQQAVCVTLYSSKKKQPIEETVTIGPDFGDGSYGFYDLKPGKYTVKFEDCDDDPSTNFDSVFLGGASKYKDATFVTITAGHESYDNSFTVILKTPTSTVGGHITKPNGTPIAGLAVHLEGASTSVTTVTNASGNYTVSGLYSGEYTVSVGGAGTLYVHKEKTVTAVQDATVTANFSLAKR